MNDLTILPSSISNVFFLSRSPSDILLIIEAPDSISFVGLTQVVNLSSKRGTVLVAELSMICSRSTAIMLSSVIPRGFLSPVVSRSRKMKEVNCESQIILLLGSLEDQIRKKRGENLKRIEDMSHVFFSLSRHLFGFSFSQYLDTKTRLFCAGSFCA